MKNDIKISVIIPVYNQELYISRCLRSLFSQKFSSKNYEIIVIDDGSNDQTKDILNKYKDDITIIKNIKNKGLPFCLNSGIRAAKGNYIGRGLR